MQPNEFWELTHKEIIWFIESRENAIKEEVELQASHNYKLSQMINNAMAGKLKPLTVYYPKLFEAEQRQVQDWRQSKANLLKFLNRG